MLEGIELLFCHFLPQHAIDSGCVISFSHITLSCIAGFPTSNLFYIVLFFVTFMQTPRLHIYTLWHSLAILIQFQSRNVTFSDTVLFCQNCHRVIQEKQEHLIALVHDSRESLPILLWQYVFPSSVANV